MARRQRQMCIRDSYWKLAQSKFDKDETIKRLKELVKKEEEILDNTFPKPRVHS